MPIHIEKFPKAALEAINVGLSRLPPNGPTRLAVRGRDPDGITVSVPHRLFVCDCRALAQGEGVSGIASDTWRALILDGEIPIMLADVSVPESGTECKVIGFSSGPFVEGTREAVVYAETLDTVRKGSFELRAITVPSLFVYALWLKNRRRGDDLVIPIPPSNRVVTLSSSGGTTIAGQSRQPQYHALTLQTFLTALATEAEMAEKFDSTPQG